MLRIIWLYSGRPGRVNSILLRGADEDASQPGGRASSLFRSVPRHEASLNTNCAQTLLLVVNTVPMIKCTDEASVEPTTVASLDVQAERCVEMPHDVRKQPLCLRRRCTLCLYTHPGNLLCQLHEIVMELLGDSETLATPRTKGVRHDPSVGEGYTVEIFLETCIKDAANEPILAQT
jgi:hypothetical protein